MQELAYSKQKGSLPSFRFQQDIPRQSFCTSFRRTERARSTRIPRQPIPRGLMAHMTGRSSDLSVTASFRLPGNPALPQPYAGLMQPRPFACRKRLFFPVTSAAFPFGSVKHDSSLTATRSCRPRTCVPFHRTGRIPPPSGTCHVLIHLSQYFILRTG